MTLSRDSFGRALMAGATVDDLLTSAGTGTPAYVYDLDAIAGEVEAAVTAFGTQAHVVAYAMKANSAGTIVRTVARSGGGTDVVSRGELEVAIGCHVPPQRIVMSGVAKTDDDLDYAIFASILAIQVESLDEIARLEARARAAARRVNVSLRINPDVRIDSHAHMATGHKEAKFGIALSDLGDAWERVDRSPSLRAVGVSTHVGSMLGAPEPYIASARSVCDVAAARLSAGHKLAFLDFGGGFGVDYRAESVKRPAEFVRAACALVRERGLESLTLVVEPGRALVAPHGVLVASVVQPKRSGTTRWALIDAAMNDLLRPALYGARHRIEPVDRPPGGATWRVAGPVCESADEFGEHDLGDPLPARVLIRDAGAYGFTMASEYNGRPLPAEIFASSGAIQHVSPSPGRDSWVARRLSA